MRKIIKGLSSRTVLTVILMFVISGFQAIEPFMSSNVYMVINAFLSSMAIYFRIDPKVDFK